ncbi:HTH-type transcriptional regulator XynR [Sporomusa carbonis]|uniref:IclR family transcriptional regulator n=1 Tax=Sporomusa carbonis TaxID=3076075 RepID=UPI003A6601BD
MPEKYLQSVDNALRILELFSDNVGELGVTEISRKLEIGRSTAHRLLTTLENRNFVEQNQTTGKYKLGIKIVNLGAHILGSLNVIKECRPFLEQVSKATGETCHLAFLSNGEDITFVDKVPGKNPAIMSSMVGLKMPAHVTGTGKAILAFLPENELERYFRKAQLKRYTPNTITDPQELRKYLEIVRQQGYSEDQQESDEGLTCFAAPVRDFTGKVIAAMSVSGAASRVNTRRDELVREIKKAAEQASRACGWSSNYEWK